MQSDLKGGFKQHHSPFVLNSHLQRGWGHLAQVGRDPTPPLLPLPPPFLLHTAPTARECSYFLLARHDDYFLTKLTV
jgi:hypothetical protein